jgi:hypothetical protein
VTFEKEERVVVLENVSVGSGHIKAHNDERDAINSILAKLEGIDGTVLEAIQSAGGGMDEPALRTFMSDTLVAGDGIGIDDEVLPDKILVSNTVEAVGLVRPWLPADLVYTQPFESIPSGLAFSPASPGPVVPMKIVAMSGAGGSNKPVAYSNALFVPQVSGSGTTGSTEIDFTTIPQLAGKSITEVRVWHSASKPWNSADVQGFVDINDVQKAATGSPSLGQSTAWAQAIIPGAANKIRFRTLKGSGQASGDGYGMYVAGLEVYATPVPWMLNNVAAYNGNLYRSTQDNNPYTPGSGQGWVQI